MAKKELTAIEWVMYKLPSDFTSPYIDLIFKKGQEIEQNQIQ